MIPGEAALEYREVVLTQHESRILLSSAAGNFHGFEVPFRACLHVRTPFGGHEKGGDRHNGQAPPAWPGAAGCFVNARALSSPRSAHHPAPWIINPSPGKHPPTGPTTQNPH